MSTLRANTISNAAGSASVPVDTVVSGSAKAWVNFNGTGTVAIRAAFNVSSITDNGTGDYTVNFTTAMPDANYVTQAFCREDYTSTTAGSVFLFGMRFAPTTTSTRIGTRTATPTSLDSIEVSVAIFR